MCDHYTLCVRSSFRYSAAAASDYSVSVPAIPKGLYKATFRMSAANTVVQEVRIRWSVTNNFDTGDMGYATALTCTYDGQGVLYITNPGTTMDIQIRDAHTGAAYDAEHVILIHLEKQ
jgi:hypothetical protein